MRRNHSLPSALLLAALGMAVPAAHAQSYTFTSFDDPAAIASGQTFAQGINDAGQVVGHYRDNTGLHGFVYASGAFTSLDDPAANGQTFAQGINDSGQVVGFFNDSVGYHGFVYTNGTYSTLDVPGAIAGQTFAQGINDAGQVVGYLVVAQ